MTFISKVVFFLSCFSSFSSFSVCASAWASDYQSPRTSALGGAGHASPLFTDALYLNPSFISFMPLQALSLGYMTYNETGLGHTVNISLQSGARELPIQFGVGYTRFESDSMVHFGVSKKFFDWYAIGVSTKLVLPGRSLESKVIDATVSLSGIFSSWFRASLIVDNLLQTAIDQGLYRQYILGTKWSLGSIIQLYLDPHWAPSLSTDSFSQKDWGYEAGVEVPVLENLFVRFGSFNNSTTPNQTQIGDGFGLGIGWAGSLFSIDYAMSRTVQPSLLWAYSIGMTAYF